ncbi:hypothetical protein KDD17_01535 [Sulfitobacter albidus]|uniref:Uncharacterized protein n=1 Tax=Sulfitobacter albidus TaxID=2829501 RepID=A0A975PMJ0_9RHOB|nr:hypothetical protein [Sulfitobacter albidus]QUJ76774.1 hypothetical protein KDD17_01535 [Sulfitobacter albidus]
MKLSIKTATLLAGVLLVAACDGSDDNGEASGISTLGSAFRAMFAADANAEPVDAQTVDISVDLTADPFNP